jgi:hypothetical protein
MFNNKDKAGIIQFKIDLDSFREGISFEFVDLFVFATDNFADCGSGN